MREFTKWEQFKLDRFDKRTQQDYFSMLYKLASGLEQYIIHMETYLPLLKKIPFDSQFQKFPEERTKIDGMKYNNLNELFRLIMVQQKAIMYSFLNYLHHNWDQVEEFIEWCEFKSEHKVHKMMNEWGERVDFDWNTSLPNCKKIVAELYKIDFIHSTNEVSLDDTTTIFNTIYKGQELFEIVSDDLAFFVGGHPICDIPALFKNEVALNCQIASFISYDNLRRKIHIHHDHFKEDPDYFEDPFFNDRIQNRKY